jgi:hypothetical protein
MSTYKNLIGKDVNFLTTDPDNAQAEGQIWYNSTSGAFKNVMVSEAWSTSGVLSLARNDLAGCGTQTAGLAFGGQQPPTVYTATEEYNGSGWSNGGDLGTATKGGGGAGTQTAGLAFGGNFPVTDVTQEYNGSSWTAGGTMGTGRYALGGAGTQTAGLAFGGRAQPANTNATEEYNGSSWTAGGGMARTGDTLIRLAGAGLQTAALGFGGLTTALTEEYDGSSWTSGGNLNTARWSLGGCGIQTSALAFGGAVPPDTAQTKTEKYDGTSWTETGALGTGRWEIAGAGSVPAALAFGGYNGTASVASTEEFNISANVITGAAWSSGGAMNTGGRSGAAGSGIQTAAIIAGGGLGSVINNSEAYNGSSWTNLPTLGTARGYMAGATNAPSTASLVFGGATGPGGPYVNNSEEYSGSSWAEGNNLNQARGYLAGFGTQTAGVAAGELLLVLEQPRLKNIMVLLGLR